MVQGVVVFQMDWCWDVSPPMLGSPIARHPVFPTPGLFFWDAVRDSLRFAEQFLKFIICIVVSNYKQLVFILYIYLFFCFCKWIVYFDWTLLGDFWGSLPHPAFRIPWKPRWTWVTRPSADVYEESTARHRQSPVHRAAWSIKGS